MNHPLRVSEEAEAEANEAWRWYNARRPGLGDDFLTAVDEALERIQLNPGLGSRPRGVASNDIRRVVVRRFPYDVVYVEVADRIQTDGTPAESAQIQRPDPARCPSCKLGRLVVIEMIPRPRRARGRPP